ncbi:hypothetical protein ACQKQC_26625 [Vibrio fortis]|uniref:hypothetical protein n=1 Tax=Vibrio fortis TaxID=212667 RepID=UPI004067DA0F
MTKMVGRTDRIDDSLTLCEPPIDIPDFDVELVSLSADSSHPRITWLSDLVKEVVTEKVSRLRSPEH